MQTMVIKDNDINQQSAEVQLKINQKINIKTDEELRMKALHVKKY